MLARSDRAEVADRSLNVFLVVHEKLAVDWYLHTTAAMSGIASGKRDRVECNADSILSISNIQSIFRMQYAKVARHHMHLERSGSTTV